MATRAVACETILNEVPNLYRDQIRLQREKLTLEAAIDFDEGVIADTKGELSRIEFTQLGKAFIDIGEKARGKRSSGVEALTALLQGISVAVTEEIALITKKEELIRLIEGQTELLAEHHRQHQLVQDRLIQSEDNLRRYRENWGEFGCRGTFPIPPRELRPLEIPPGEPAQ